MRVHEKNYRGVHGMLSLWSLRKANGGIVGGSGLRSRNPLPSGRGGINMPILRSSSIAAEKLSGIVTETRKLGLYDIPTDSFQNLSDTLKAVTS